MVDLSLFVPNYLLENERFRQFIEVLSESIGEVLQNISDLEDLWKIWKREDGADWLVYLLEKIGYGWLWSGSFAVGILDGGVDFLRRKGTNEFFNKIFKQIGFELFFEDLSKFCLNWSGGRAWSSSVFENDVFYRDYSVLLNVSYIDVDLLKRLVPLGVFVWVLRLFAVIYFEMYLFVSDFSFSSFDSFRSSFNNRVFLSKEEVNSFPVQFLGVIDFDYEEYRYVLNTGVIVLRKRYPLLLGVDDIAVRKVGICLSIDDIIVRKSNVCLDVKDILIKEE